MLARSPGDPNGRLGAAAARALAERPRGRLFWARAGTSKQAEGPLDFFEALNEVAHLDVASFTARHPHPILLEDASDEEPGGERRLLELAGKQKELVLGRAAGCDLRVDHPHVSGRHLVIERTTTTALRVRDLGSTNGTSVDSVRLAPGQPARLKPGSVLGLGPELSFTLHDGASLHAALASVAQTVTDAITASSFETHLDEDDAPGERTLLKPGEAAAAPPDPALGQSPSPESTGALDGVEIFAASDPIAPVAIPTDREVTIGRASGVDLLLLHPSVSRRHASLTRRRDLILVRDLGSSNGVFVGGRRVASERLVEPGGAPIAIGVYEVRLVVARPGAAASSDTTQPLPSDGLRGTLETMSLAELLQGVELNRRTGTIRVEAEGVTGEIAFRVGLPVRASYGAVSGEEAVIALLGLERGQFVYVPGDPFREKTPTRQIGTSLTKILLEASRRADETRR